MAEEDEDVDLENTPLYHYMQEYGLTQRTVETTTHINGSMSSYKTTLLAVVKEIKTCVCLYASYGHFITIYDGLLEKFLLEHREAVLNCRALVEEDAQFLENIFADRSMMHSADCRQLNSIFWKRLFLVTCLLFSYGIAKFQNDYSSFSIPFTSVVECVFLLALCGYFIFNLSLIVMTLKRKMRYQESFHSLQTFIGKSGEFLQCIKHCLCYLQELEVIGRGLFLTKPGTTVSSLDQSLLFPRSPFPSSCLCIPLRFSFFRNVRCQLSAIKSTTLQLMDSFPLREEFDHKSHYIAHISDEEFGPVLKADINNDEKILLATNNLSVSALKSVCQLYSVLLSELLRRLALSFNPKLFGSSSNNSMQKVFQILPVILEPLNSGLQTSCTRLKDSYLFHQLASQLKKTSNLKSSCRTPVYTTHGSMATAIRSLTLHLQVSLARVNDFSDQLQKIGLDSEKLKGDKCHISHDAFKVLNSELELMNQDLIACKACWDESSLRLRKLCNKEDSNDEFLSSEAAKIQLPPEVPLTKISLLERTDIAPADQIFEAYADEDENPASEGEAFGDMELRKKALEERDISKRMLSELKVVLVSKSEEWQEREAKVLALSGVMPYTVLDRDEMPDISVGIETIRMPMALQLNDATSENNDIPKVDVEEDGNLVKQALKISSLPFDSPFSIAAMAAARSRMLNLNSCMEGETFKSVGEEYFGSDSSSDEDVKS